MAATLGAFDAEPGNRRVGHVHTDDHRLVLVDDTESCVVN